MNLYVRYFDHECVAKSVEESIDFLNSIGDIKLESNTANRITTFLKSSNLYPFRLKVSFSNYVLFLKTEAETLEDFKIEEANRKEQKVERPMSMADKKKSILEALNEQKIGWWDGVITFKRVLTDRNGKCQYVDTRFRARLKAISAMDAYNRIIDHLKSRDDIDPRSQFPAAKSPSCQFTFLEPTDAEQ
ncbi:MAG: hypothetical protein MJZ41_05460 [Bacteroidaceae bacterium]|nr:hypothetical protein [Bacteroidaceae bacterium]